MAHPKELHLPGERPSDPAGRAGRRTRRPDPVYGNCAMRQVRTAHRAGMPAQCAHSSDRGG
jgi:hypothetical protein